MKLFDKLEAVKFPEENLIFITRDKYLYYIYDSQRKFWRKHRHAGNESITVENYPNVTKEELMNALGGTFPTKESDFIRVCNPMQLNIRDMLYMLGEDYPRFMSDNEVYHIVRNLLQESDVRHKTYLKIRENFDNTATILHDNKQLIRELKELGVEIIGRDIFKKEIRIVDGHNSSSYFWIMPIRVIDFKNTNGLDSVASMRSVEISIEEDDVNQYLTPFLYKYFDDDLEANKRRIENYGIDDEGNYVEEYVEGFEWYLTHNFYTFESMKEILSDIRDTLEVLLSGGENEYTKKMREKRGWDTYQLLYVKGFDNEEDLNKYIKEYNANRPKEDNTEVELIVDFYQRFIYRMEYMMKVGEENGYNLISFMGP